MSGVWNWGAIIAVGSVGLIALGACATEETLNVGDPAKVSGGFGEITNTNDAACTPDFDCAVSWKDDVYAAIFDAPTSASMPSGACGAADCHDSGAGGLTFPVGNATDAYLRLTSYNLAGVGSYIVACRPDLSPIMCNLAFAEGVENPYVGPTANFTGGCGSPMPKLTAGSAGDALNQEQLNTIAGWIACGAPQN